MIHLKTTEEYFAWRGLQERRTARLRLAYRLFQLAVLGLALSRLLS